MILTGVCKIDFENYVQDLQVAPYVSMLDNIPVSYLYALIIDFFDSKGINILIHNFDFQNWWYYEVKYFPHKDEGKFMKDSRQKATEEAIKFANEYYNKQYGNRAH